VRNLRQFWRTPGNCGQIDRQGPADGGSRHALELAACAVSAARWPVVNVTRRDPATKREPDKQPLKLLHDSRSARTCSGIDAI
jgi:hypothetical protein